MSASGKSSNRRSEYARGYSGAGGHGIYAEAGKADRRAADERAARREALDAALAEPPRGPTLFDLLRRRARP